MRPSTRPRSGRPTASLSARRPGTVNDPGDRDTIVDDEPGGFQGCSGVREAGRGPRARLPDRRVRRVRERRPPMTAMASLRPATSSASSWGPSVTDHVTTSRDVHREEVFGPVLPALVLRDDLAGQDQPVTRRQRPVYLQRRGRPVPTKQGRGRDDRHQRCPSRCGWPTPPSAAGRSSGSGRAGCTGTRGGHIHLPRGGNPALAPAKRRSTGADCHFLTAS